MQKFICTAIFSIVLLFSVYAQQSTLSGKITDQNGQPLSSATIYIKEGNFKTTSDASGRFSFQKIKPGNYELTAELLGYNTVTQQVTITDGMSSLNVVLPDMIRRLDHVIIKDRHPERRKLEESLNIETVNADFIQRNLGGSLMKTLERLPGIKTIGIGSGQSKPLIRGLGFNRVVVVDKGVKHEGQQWGADHGLELDQFAAGEVELIKGAASFVYGSDAIGGAIVVKPAAVPAPESLGGTVDLLGKTNNNLYGTSINLFGRNQHWFFDSRLTYQDYGDYRVPTDTVYVYDYAVRLHKNYLRNTAGKETAMHLTGGFISDRFRSVFYLSNVFSNNGFFANAHGLEPRNVDTELHDHSDRDILLPGQRVNHFKIINKSVYQKGIHQFEMELGYQRNFRSEFSQYVNHGYMPPVYPDTMAISGDLEREFDKHVYSANFRDNISLGKHRLTIGFNAEKQQNSIDGYTFLVPGFRQTTAGAFLYDKFEFSENLILHGAVRYDHGQIRMLKYTDWFPSTVTQDGMTRQEHVTRANDLSRSFNSLVWSLGLNYNKDKFSLKANIGKSFRMPIAKELGANGVNYHYFSFERGDPSLSPEQSYQGDLSLGFTADNWSLQISPFYNYFSNYIYLNPTSGHDTNYGAGNQIFQYAQSGVVRYGGEVQFKMNFLKTLSTELLGEYLHAEQRSGDKRGYTLPFSPPASLLLNLTWSPGLSKKLQDTYLSIDYRITAEQNNIVPPERKTPGYKVINIQAGTRLKFYRQTIMLSLQAQNLLNTRYLNHTSFYRLIELPEAGRNIIMSVKVPFSIH